MSDSQSYTNKEVKKLLRSVCVAIWGLDLAADKVWIDSAKVGQKSENYAIITVTDREPVGSDDPARYYWAEGEGEDPQPVATEEITRDRRLVCSVLTFGPDAEDLAQKVSDNLRCSEHNEALWASGVGLISHSEPRELPMNEGQRRTSFWRVSVVLSVSETRLREANYIQYVEISSPSLGIPEQTIELPTPGGS